MLMVSSNRIKWSIFNRVKENLKRRKLNSILIWRIGWSTKIKWKRAGWWNRFRSNICWWTKQGRAGILPMTGLGCTRSKRGLKKVLLRRLCCLRVGTFIHLPPRTTRQTRICGCHHLAEIKILNPTMFWRIIATISKYITPIDGVIELPISSSWKIEVLLNWSWLGNTRMNKLCLVTSKKAPNKKSQCKFKISTERWKDKNK